MNKMLLLSALLLATALPPRGEGDNNNSQGNGNQNNNDGRFTEEEWNARNQARHAQTSHADLVKALTAAERKAERLEANQVPKGGRALTAEEAQAYDAYVAFGKPDEVKAKLEQGEQASAELTGLKSQRDIDAAATDAGFKPTVLADRLKADGLTLLPSREVERDGKKVKVPVVKDANGTEHELPTYAKDKWADYLPALTAATSTQTDVQYTQQDTAGTTTTTTSGGGGGGSWVQQALAKAAQGGGAYVDPLQPGAAAAK